MVPTPLSLGTLVLLFLAISSGSPLGVDDKRDYLFVGVSGGLQDGFPDHDKYVGLGPLA